MGTRVPVNHYNLNSPSSFIESPLHVLNTVEGRAGEMDEIEADVDREAVTEDSLDNDNDASAVVSGLHIEVILFLLELSLWFLLAYVGLVHEEGLLVFDTICYETSFCI